MHVVAITIPDSMLNKLFQSFVRYRDSSENFDQTQVGLVLIFYCTLIKPKTILSLCGTCTSTAAAVTG